MPTALDTKQEFYNANSSKAYPLDQSTGGVTGTLPCGLLVDAYVLVDGIESTNEIEAYISEVEVTSTGFILSLTVSASGNSYNFERVAYISFENAMYSEVEFISAEDGVSVAGAFTVGDPTLVKLWAPSTTLSAAQGLLSPLVIKNINAMFITSLVVGDTVLTGGTIAIEAGDGIELAVNGSTITISNTKYLLDGGTASTSEQLVAEATEIYGTPIRSINGVVPDDQGNISIIVPATESTDKYFVIPQNETSGVGSLTLSINRDPCVDNDTVDALMQNISELNKRAARLDDGQKALDNAINSMAIQLTRL